MIKIDKIVERLYYKDVVYSRDVRDFGEHIRGTVNIENKIIPSYPKIPRAFFLKEAIRKQFGNNKFIVEEKIDGTNIRVFYHANSNTLLAFTRGGYVCPYSTEILQENKNIMELLQDFPHLCVFGELIGNNPYNHVSTIYGLEPKILVFDIFKVRKDYQLDLLLPLQRKELLERYEIDSVPIFGVMDINDYKEIEEKLQNLEDKGREGIVLKSVSGMEPRLKYITFNACVIAIADHIAKGFEQSAPGTKERFYLAGAYLEKIGGIKKEQAYNLFGEMILERLTEAIEKGEATEQFTIKISEEGWKLLKRRMRKHVIIREEKKKKIGKNKMEITFSKIYPKSTGFIREFLKGKVYFD
ncbi:MAG: RNA ligase [Candidatus Heimdallarchaeum aukensis]|uniref:RNA ligase n=1 Tax=Candidatus Heimdallarchaeum aukensis TaxID=2876573 RepID=A0A9Y1BJF6_9ARCH|nr:MAG: RNA ligase [Candidatus Heimdallarchaeum aukensis]